VAACRVFVCESHAAGNEPGYGCASCVVYCQSEYISQSHTTQHTTHIHNQAHSQQCTTYTQYDMLPRHQGNITKLINVCFRKM